MRGEWDDEAGEHCREGIQRTILGELRLLRRDRERILADCREIYLEGCPDNEMEGLSEFAAREFDRMQASLSDERATWDVETDCDRLDRVEARLRDQGILLWQASPCCDSCTGGELPDRLEFVNTKHPGIQERLQGYAFFIDQNLPEMLADGPEISVYLAYGWVSPDGTEVGRDEYKREALRIARLVSDCLREEGLEVDWDGDFHKKIGVNLMWQRRRPLE